MTKGIRKRGASYLVDVTRKGTRKTAPVATMAEAEAKRVERLHSMMNGRTLLDMAPPGDQSAVH